MTGVSLFHRHLTNADLLSWGSWFKHPLRSATRLIPLRVKENINRVAAKRVFDLSFYLQFQPGSLIVENTLIKPLRYFPKESSGRLRVALITPHLGPGGAEAVLQEIAAGLRPDQFEVLLLATQSRDSRWSGRWRRYVEHVYDLARVVAPEHMPATVFTIVSNWKCDAVLVQNSLSGYAALPHIKSAAPDALVIDLIHALDARWDQIALTAKVAAHIDLRVAPSSSVRDRLLEAGTLRDRVRVIPNGVDLERFRSSPVRVGGTPRILFVGRLDPVKRPLLLVEIAARLVKRRGAQDFKMIVAGDGPDSAALRRRVRRAALEGVFEFHGFIDDVASLFGECDVCVLPSRAEGIPLVVLEALASARPVVASNVGAVSELLDPSCGVLIDVDARESDAFADALNALLERPDVRTKMGEAGRKKIEAKYDIRRTREVYLKLFDQVAATTPFSM